MKRLEIGLLGKNINHSRSQQVYESLLERKIDYTLFDFEKQEDIPSLSTLFKGLQGLSITSPYKKQFFNQVQKDVIAQELGAVNCIKRHNNTYMATLTDYYATRDIFLSLQDGHQIKKVFILGDGVMSHITQYIMRQNQTTFEIFSRKKTKNFHNLNLQKMSGQGTLIINTCSREYHYKGFINTKALFWDYNYNFIKHNHLKNSLQKNYIDGISLLYSQAKYAVNFLGLAN